MLLMLLAAAASMAARDLLGTFLTVAEARGRAWLAGTMDALGDLAGIAVTVLGAGQLIIHGLTEKTVLLLTVITVTSLLGTALWTRLAQRIQPAVNGSQAVGRAWPEPVGITTTDNGGIW